MDINPCIKCGEGRMVYVLRFKSISEGADLRIVRCNHCGEYGKGDWDKNQAIQSWNKMNPKVEESNE